MFKVKTVGQRANHQTTCMPPSLSHGYNLNKQISAGMSTMERERERGRDGLIAVDFQSSKVLSPRPCRYRGELLSPLVSWVKEEGPRAVLPLQKSVLMGAEQSRGRERQKLNQDFFHSFISPSAFSIFSPFRSFS